MNIIIQDIFILVQKGSDGGVESRDFPLYSMSNRYVGNFFISLLETGPFRPLRPHTVGLSADVTLVTVVVVNPSENERSHRPHHL